jgi:hypothetical protein
MKCRQLLSGLFLGVGMATSPGSVTAAAITLGSLEVAFVSSPWGEVVDDPMWSFYGERRFGLFLAQTFTAPAGQADSITLRLRAPFPTHPDGVDFRVLFSEVSENRPSRVIYQSPIYTLGAAAGISGTNVSTALPITIDLPQIDLVDGSRYAFVIDTVSTADGLHGAGSFQGNRAFLDGTIMQLTVTPDGRAIIPWEIWGDDASGNDLSFGLHFAEGGIANPTHAYLWDFAGRYRRSVAVVPEPATLALVGAALLGIATTRRRKPVKAAAETAC